MATAKTKKAQVEATPEVQETPKVIRPNDLAKELNVDGKRIRAYLRQEFTRPTEAKNSSWVLTDAQVAKVRERFTASDDGNDESTDES